MLRLSNDMIDASDEEEVGKNEDAEDAVMNLLDEEGQVGAEMLEGEPDSVRDLRLRAAELDREQELEEGLDEDYEIPVGSSGFGPDFDAAGRPLDPNVIYFLAVPILVKGWKEVIYDARSEGGSVHCFLLNNGAVI